MEESRTQKIQQLLRRLGKAVHGSVVRSEEVQECLHELHEAGWDAVMLLEASLACRSTGAMEVEDASMHVHVDPSSTRVAYRINARDAGILSSLGISPSRHRSAPSQPCRDADDQPGR
jgi:hypothetical protein